MTLLTTLAVVLIAAVPGVAAASALHPPGRVDPIVRLALVFGLGYALSALVALALALAHALHAWTFLVAVGAVTAGLAWRAARGGGAVAHARALGAQIAADRWAVAAGLGAVGIVAATRALSPAQLALGASGPWRYWADGLDIAAVAGIPSASAQWGGEFRPAVGKAAMNSFEAALALIAGPEPFPAMAAMNAVAAVGVVTALWALGRRLGLGPAAPLVPVLTVLVPDALPLSREMTDDLEVFRAENLGRLATVCGVLAGLDAIAPEGRRRDGAACAALFATAALTHLVATLFLGAAALGMAAVGTCLIAPARTRRVVGVLAATGVAGGLIWAAAITGSGQSLGFEAATSGPTTTVLPAWADPTGTFKSGRVVRLPVADGRFVYSPGRIARTHLARAAGRRWGRRPPAWAYAALAALATATAFTLYRTGRRFAVLFAIAWGVPVLLYVAALFFSVRYSTSVPANFGLNRLDDYLVVPVALTVPALIAALLASPGARRAVACLAAVALAAAALARVADDDERTRVGARVMETVSATVPCDARLLPSARTAGSFAALIGRRSVLEGMAPYLRPDLTGHVVPLILGARRFFRAPADNARFLDRHRIDNIVVVREGAIGSEGGRVGRRVDEDGLRALRGWHIVADERAVLVLARGTGSARKPAAGGACPFPRP